MTTDTKFSSHPLYMTTIAGCMQYFSLQSQFFKTKNDKNTGCSQKISVLYQYNEDILRFFQKSKKAMFNFLAVFSKK